MNSDLTPDRAAQILGTAPGTPAEERHRLFQEKRDLLERKLAQAPTPGLKAKLRLALDELTAAFECLEISETESDLGAIRPVFDEAPVPSARAAPAAAVTTPLRGADNGVQPSGESSVHARRRKSNRQFQLACVAVALVGLTGAFFALDGMGRIKASQAFKEAEAVVATDVGSAVGHFARALELRPDTARYRDAFEKTQTRWFEQLEADVAGKLPAEAWDFLAAESVAAVGAKTQGTVREGYRRLIDDTGKKLRAVVLIALQRGAALANDGRFDEARATIEPWQRFARMMPEIKSTQDDLEAAVVASQVAGALKVGREGKFDEALGLLDDVSRKGIALQEIEAARNEIRRQAAFVSIGKLSSAILQGDAGRLAGELATYQRTADVRVTLSAESILNETDLSRFLDYLAELRIRPVSSEERQNRFDLLMIEKMRSRFADAGAVDRFLHESYLEWAREKIAAGRPGQAAYLAVCARTGTTGNAKEFEREVLDELAGRLRCTIVVRPAEATQSASRGLAMSLLDMTRTTLVPSRLSWWMSTTDEVSSSEPPPLRVNLKTKLVGVDGRRDRSSETRSVRYLAGYDTERNSDYAHAVEMLSSWQSTLSEAQATNLQAEQNVQQAAGLNSSGLLWGSALVSGMAKTNLNEAESEVRKWEGEVRSTPQTVQVERYADERYQVISHSFRYSATWSMALHDGRTDVPGALSLNAADSHQTTEVAGNADRGVPVQAPVFLDEGEVNERLGTTLAEGLRGKSVEMQAYLMKATFAALEARILAEKLPAEAASDLRWALAQLWEASGVSVPNRRALGDAVAGELGVEPRR